ncbi:hypothetical protein EJV47_15455 [Hymenobacter gummosus]|uniref:SMI1/KNR4 family protein n=1 Tax=Hymenobacter gummosus TaxID=1776032 RepID=A0A3S0H4D4_9BACT|nr:hypothetical protein [Hymenobacter gummosus]RTQ48985.1 hypothetical protein EJV47_15455 [Hymenobacter gummosus]
MHLSKRAAAFLAQQQWRADAVRDPAVVARAFTRLGLQPSPALLDFQLTYGGLMLYAGLEPICFGLLHGKLARGDFSPPHKADTLIHEPPDEDRSHHLFACADTLYQMDFHLDEQGRYYENWQLHANSFDAIIEDKAVWAELRAQPYERVYFGYFEEGAIPVAALAEAFQVAPYPDLPPDLIYWGRNEQLVVRRSADKLMVFSLTEPADDVAARGEQLLATYTNAPSMRERTQATQQQAQQWATERAVRPWWQRLGAWLMR